MLHFRMNMPFVLMAFYGSLMIMAVLLLRALLKRRLPKFVFPIIWFVVLLRLLVPFSLSSPFSIKMSGDSILSAPAAFIYSLNENIAFFNYAETTYTISGKEAQATAVPQVSQEDVPPEEPQGTLLFQGSMNGSSKSADTAVTGIEGASIKSIAEEASATYIGSGRQGIFPIRIPTGALLPAVYLLGLIAASGALLLQKYRCNARLKDSLLIEHNETINAILRDMNMGHILVFTNDGIASPLVSGLFTQCIYLPARMDFRNTELLRHILTHEAMHIKRGDNRMKAVMLAALCIHWFNPLVWIMSRCLSSDLETACDEAVLRSFHDDEQRKSYAYSLLAMAITGNRATLLYSAFSKTEVEKRIQGILSYKKASALLVMAAVLFMLCSSTAFATCLPAPFSSYLTSYCASSGSRWGVRVSLTRDVALGANPQRRAEDIVFDVLNEDTSNDPELIEIKLRNALSDEFHVENSAFLLSLSLCITEEERNEEWAKWGLAKGKDGFFLYKGEPARVFVDETGGFYQSREEGTVDIRVLRDRFGYISSVSAQHEGDSDFDRRSRDIERSRLQRGTYDGVAAEVTSIEDDR